jgi:hypothetical protein
MTERSKNLEQKQEKAISALLQAQSLREAAKEAGISEATLHRWLKLEAFQEAYRAAKREVVNFAICRLQRSSGKAVETLEGIMKGAGNPATSKVSAAKIVLEMALKGVEVEDLERRIADLEKFVRQQNEGPKK